jgi:hypothetical protein
MSTETVSVALPTDPKARKNLPLVRGLLDYFPAALAAVADVSRVGNEQHNPGQPMHHARGKSTDHADCIVRHLMDRGTLDTDGLRHAAKVAWRALALLQEELEAAGAPLARGAKAPAPAEPIPEASAVDVFSRPAAAPDLVEACENFHTPDEWCRALEPYRPGFPQFACSRKRDHTGRHIGANSSLVSDHEHRSWKDKVERHG